MMQNVMKCDVFWVVAYLGMQFGYHRFRETSVGLKYVGSP